MRAVHYVFPLIAFEMDVLAKVERAGAWPEIVGDLAPGAMARPGTVSKEDGTSASPSRDRAKHSEKQVRAANARHRVYTQSLRKSSLGFLAFLA